MPSTNWLAAAPGPLPLAQQVNQFLVSHPTMYLYTGTQTAQQITAGATSTSSNSLWLAQSFATAVGQTAVGYVTVPITTTSTSGTALAPTTLSLYANSGGAPTGSALVSTTLTAEYANFASGGTATVLVDYPLPVTGLTASTTYWLVLHSTASTGFYTWYRSNQVTGASTSSNGTTWAAQAYGFEYQISDQTASGALQLTWEDAGARWTWSNFNALAQLTQYAEYTVAQGANAYVQSTRTLTYSSGLLTKVA